MDDPDLVPEVEEPVAGGDRQCEAGAPSIDAGVNDVKKDDDDDDDLRPNKALAVDHAVTDVTHMASAFSDTSRSSPSSYSPSGTRSCDEDSDIETSGTESSGSVHLVHGVGMVRVDDDVTQTKVDDLDGTDAAQAYHKGIPGPESSVGSHGNSLTNRNIQAADGNTNSAAAESDAVVVEERGAAPASPDQGADEPRGEELLVTDSCSVGDSTVQYLPTADTNDGDGDGGDGDGGGNGDGGGGDDGDGGGDDGDGG
eukprot:scpid95502/ scgid5878/ 